MRKVSIVLAVLLMATILAPAVLAQAPAAKPPDQVAMWIAIASGFSMAVAAAVCGLAQSRVAAAACEGMARNPGAGDAIRLAMILGLVFIETLALFTLLVVFVKVAY